MCRLVPEPSLRDKIYNLRGEHGRAKDKVRMKVSEAVNKAMEEFQEETGGLFITDISLEIIKHYRGSECDMAIVSSIHIKTNIEGDF